MGRADPVTVVWWAQLGGGLLFGLLGGMWLPHVLRGRLLRTNFRGDPIGTAGGLLLLPAAAVGLLGSLTAETTFLLALAGGYGLLGFLDDARGTAEFRGFRGHLGALRQGRVTTGLVKAAGGLILGGAAAVLVPGERDVLGRCAMALFLPLMANLLNLLDLRPLRALKCFWLGALPLALAGPGPLLAVVGATVGYAPSEARRRLMLGDTGANLLGGLLGAAVAQALSTPVLVVGVALLLSLQLWAERNSISALIARTPLLRSLDDLGRGGDQTPEAR